MHEVSLGPNQLSSLAATRAAALVSAVHLWPASQGAGARGRACATCGARRAARGAVAAGRRAGPAARAQASIGVRISSGARVREGDRPCHAAQQRGIAGGRLPAGGRPDARAPATRCTRGGGRPAGRARARAVAAERSCARSRLAACQRAGPARPAGIRCRGGALSTVCGNGQGGRGRRSWKRGVWGIGGLGVWGHARRPHAARPWFGVGRAEQVITWQARCSSWTGSSGVLWRHQSARNTWWFVRSWAVRWKEAGCVKVEQLLRFHGCRCCWMRCI